MQQLESLLQGFKNGITILADNIRGGFDYFWSNYISCSIIKVNSTYVMGEVVHFANPNETLSTILFTSHHTIAKNPILGKKYPNFYQMLMLYGASYVI